jgi:hypothetical protein
MVEKAWKCLGRLRSVSNIYRNFLGNFYRMRKGLLRLRVRVVFSTQHSCPAGRRLCMALFHEPARSFVQRTRLAVCGSRKPVKLTHNERGS